MPETPLSSYWPGLVLAALAIIVPIVLYLLSRERREMSYLVSSNYRLLSLLEESIPSDIHILFKSKEVRDLHLVVVGIGNTGNKPIKTGDFSTPLSLAFGDKASVIDYDIIKEETKPPGLCAEALKATSMQGDRISISRILMNPGDRVAIKALVSGFQELTVDGRIFGIKEIHKRDTLESHRVLRKVLDIADVVAFGWILIGSLMTSELPEILRTKTIWGGLLYGAPTPIVFLAPALAYVLVRVPYWAIRPRVHRQRQPSRYGR